jgi:hypothetical protein
MVTEIIGVLSDALVGLVTAMTDVITSTFAGLVYDSANGGLQDFAVWTLAFAGIGILIGLFNRVSNKI